MVGMDGEIESGKSMLSARLVSDDDDDDDDIKMHKSDEINRNISFMFFFFCNSQRVFTFGHRLEKYTIDKAYPLVEWRMFSFFIPDR